MNRKSLAPLAIAFAISGVWDTIGAMMYFFLIGSGRKIDNPIIDPFYAVFIGSFLICFAYLQFLSATNIKRYAFNVGCLIIGRAFYVIQLYAYMGFVRDFPRTFWYTGIVDGLFTILYVLFAVWGGLGARDLFLPRRGMD
jgi:hypothetical protein